jgi:predicted Zn-dependent protease
MAAMDRALEVARNRFAPRSDAATEWTLRIVRQSDEVLGVRRGVAEPYRHNVDFGAMVCVARNGGVGYAATSDLTGPGLRDAFDRAEVWAERCGSTADRDGGVLPQPAVGSYRTPSATPWSGVSPAEKLSRLRELSASLVGDARTPNIVDWSASLWRTHVETLLVGSGGGEVRQEFDFLVPMACVTASDDLDSQTRTFGGHACARQGGLELLDALDFWRCGPRLREESLALLAADNCPSGVMPVVLSPDQMILQIHESVGHPLELDRILGDERNYAGGSFVTADMFGVYRYGSEQLNVTFDPTVVGELATYGYDDEGQPAERADIIRDGILLRPLGGARSQARAGLAGVANARSSGWARPAIDRIGNLNLEPGTASFAELIGGVDDGVYMETNRSWSIDDARNKFQFGCEYGRRIRNGRLAEVIKNPNYRGVSATFWRSLDGVGDRATVQVMGTPFCGKGEPNQIIRVGHASPPCRFRDVDVFGGE